MLKNIVIGTHIYSYYHQAVQLLAFTRVMQLRKLWLFWIIHSHVRGCVQLLKTCGRQRNFLLLLQYVHFMKMWYTFLMETLLHNEHTACQFDTSVQLKYVPFNHQFLQNQIYLQCPFSLLFSFCCPPFFRVQQVVFFSQSSFS